jgi:hypothetical protein
MSQDRSPPGDIEYRIIRSTRSGRVAAKTAHVIPPDQTPNNDARSEPAASRTTEVVGQDLQRGQVIRRQPVGQS